MSALNEAVAVSGWVGTFIGVAYIGVQRVEARRERTQKEQLASLLARAVDQPVFLGVDGDATWQHVTRPAQHREQVRAALVKAAAGHQPLKVALAQLRDLKYEELEIVAVAEDLKARNLLDFSQPVTSETVLSLRV
jgi:hypothetical protein